MKFTNFLQFMQYKTSEVSPFSLFEYQNSFPFFQSFLCMIFYFINFNILFFLRDHNGNKALKLFVLSLLPWYFLCIYIYFVIFFCIFSIWQQHKPTYLYSSFFYCLKIVIVKDILQNWAGHFKKVYNAPFTALWFSFYIALDLRGPVLVVQASQ